MLAPQSSDTQFIPLVPEIVSYKLNLVHTKENYHVVIHRTLDHLVNPSNLN